jgi:amino acid permease
MEVLPDPSSEDVFSQREPILVDSSGNPILPDAPPSPSIHGFDDVTSPADLEGTKEPQSVISRVGRFATAMNLINTLIGAGVVGIPATFKQSGIGPTIISLLASCSMCYTAGNVVVALQRDLNVVGLDQLGEIVFGTWGKIGIGCLCSIFSLSCCISYLIIGTGKILDWLSFTSLPVTGTWPWAIVCLIYACLFPVALTIPRQVSFFSKIGPFSLVSILFYGIGISVKSILQTSRNGDISETVEGYQFGTGIFSAFAVHALTFSLPIVMTPALAPYNPDLRKRKLVLGVTYIFCWIVISVPSLFGYLLKGSACESDILRSFDKDDILIILIQAAILLKDLLVSACGRQPARITRQYAVWAEPR